MRAAHDDVHDLVARRGLDLPVLLEKLPVPTQRVVVFVVAEEAVGLDVLKARAVLVDPIVSDPAIQNGVGEFTAPAAADLARRNTLRIEGGDGLPDDLGQGGGCGLLPSFDKVDDRANVQGIFNPVGSAARRLLRETGTSA